MGAAVKVLLLVFLLLGFQVAQARDVSAVFRGPIASGMGGAGLAGFDPNESAFLNPASLSFFNGYFGTLFFSGAQNAVDGRNQQFGVLLSDANRNGLFAGAIGASHDVLHPVGGGYASANDFYVAASGFIYPNLSLGLAARYLMFDDVTQKKFNQPDGTISLLYSPLAFLSVGAVASNLLNPVQGIPTLSRPVPTYGIGATYFYQQTFELRLDAEKPDQDNPKHRTNIMTGLQTFFTPRFAFRLGWRWFESEAQEQRVVTAGFGFKGPKLSFDYAFEKDTLVATGFRHSVDLWMPF